MQAVDGRRSAYDPDEIEEERRDRERRLKINNEFRRFTKKVQDQWDAHFAALKLEWDTPFRCAAPVLSRYNRQGRMDGIEGNLSLSCVYHRVSTTMHMHWPIIHIILGY